MKFHLRRVFNIILNFDKITDTPAHIKKIHSEIWLSKTPAERLRQFCNYNDMLMQFWKKGGDQFQSAGNQLQDDSATMTGTLQQ